MILLIISLIIHIVIAIGLLGSTKQRGIRKSILIIALAFIPFYLLSCNYYLNSSVTKLEVAVDKKSITYQNLYGSMQIDAQDIYGIIKIDNYTLKVVTKPQVFYLDVRRNKVFQKAVDDLSRLYSWQGPIVIENKQLYLSPLVKEDNKEKILNYQARTLRGYSEYFALLLIIMVFINLFMLEKIFKERKKLWIAFVAVNGIYIPIQILFFSSIVTTVFLTINPLITLLLYTSEP